MLIIKQHEQIIINNLTTSNLRTTSNTLAFKREKLHQNQSIRSGATMPRKAQSYNPCFCSSGVKNMLSILLTNRNTMVLTLLFVDKITDFVLVLSLTDVITLI